MSPRFTVFLVEDMDFLRDSVRMQLAALPGIAIVGEAADGPTAIAEIRRAKPDCVLLDLELPLMDGFEVMAEIRPVLPEVKFLIMSGHCNQRVAQRIKVCGVAGFIDKYECTLDALKDAVLTVAAGRTYFAARFREISSVAARPAPGVIRPVFTKREVEILSYVAGAHSKETIAGQLGLSEKTVETHVKNIRRKLGISSLPELVVYAVINGYAPLHPPLIQHGDGRHFVACLPRRPGLHGRLLRKQ